MRRTSRILGSQVGLIVLALWCLPGPTWARTPDFPAPPDANTVWVSQNLVQNGIPNAIRKFQSTREPERVLGFYRKEWQRGGPEGTPGYRDAYHEPWAIVSRLEGDYLLTVQVQADRRGGSWGYLTQSPLPGMLASGDVPEGNGNFPSLRGSTVRDRVTSRDPGKHAETLIVENSFSIGMNRDFYLDHYEHAGWGIRTDEPTPAGHVVVATKGAERHNLVIQRNASGGTDVVVNAVRREAW